MVLVRQAPADCAEAKDMLRALTVLFVLVFVAASGMTAQTLTSNGDTGLIVVETVICVALLSGALYCRRRREMLTE